MRLNYKKLGPYIQQVDVKNKELEVEKLLGVSITKEFIISIANTIGTDMSKYKIVRTNQFAYGPVTSRNGDKISVAHLKEDDCIISTSYTVFEIIKPIELLPEYLMMWFRRSEFDRYARYMSHGSVREIFGWEEMCNVELPIPSPEKQREIVQEYHTVTDRIKFNEYLNQKLEETAQALYWQWFVEFEFPISAEYAASIGKPELEGQSYKSSGGEMEWCEEVDQEIPNGWQESNLSTVADILMGSSPSGESYNQDGNGEVFYQGRTEFGFRYPSVKTYTTEPKRMAKQGDILMSVRAPVGDLNIANQDCCIGRGISSLSSKINANSFLYYLMQNVQSLFNVSNDGGTVFGSITKEELHSLKILKPSNNVAIDFDKIVKDIDKNIELVCHELILLNDMKEVILSKMATIKG